MTKILPLTCAALALGALLAGCTGHNAEDSRVYDVDRASEVFEASYGNISEIFIERVDLPEIVVTGLDGLDEIEPGFDARIENDQIAVAVRGQETGRFAIPSEDDSEAWGDLTALAIESGRGQSARLGEAPPEDLYRAFFYSLVEELDGYSRYSGRDQARENRASRDGFGGIGVRIRIVDEGVKVVSVMERTPAEDAGLEDNDVIVQIDGVPAAGLSQEDSVRLLRGPVRSKVNVMVAREGVAEGLPFSIVRGHVVPQTVRYQREGDAAFIRIAGFNQDTAITLRERMLQAEAEIGDNLKGFIIDLRGNPGGLLDQSVAVTDLFVTDGRIVSTHGRHPDSHQFFTAQDDDLARGLPVIVLINGGSASASEIVAAALQDTGRAVVIGSNSYGKGTVQTVLRLPNEGELTLTWARFHAPSGYTLQQRGVLPNICTTQFNDSVDETLAKISKGDGVIDQATRTRAVDLKDEEALGKHRAKCPLSEVSRDLELQVALRLIEDRTLYSKVLRGRPDTAQKSLF